MRQPEQRAERKVVTQQEVTDLVNDRVQGEQRQQEIRAAIRSSREADAWYRVAQSEAVARRARREFLRSAAHRAS